MLSKKKKLISILVFVLSITITIVFFSYNKFKKPYFSIIISSYNYAEFVSKTIESVLASSYQNFELIVVNDGSTDKTAEILLKYKNHPRITVINQDNQGLSLARNKAMKLARGKYFWFVDADDWIDVNALEKLYKKTKNIDVDMVSFYTMPVNQDGSYANMKNWDMLPSRFKKESDKIFTIDELSMVEIMSYPVTSGKQIYRREFIQKNGIEFPAKTLFEDDVFFFHSLFADAKFSFLTEVLYYKRHHGGSIVADKSKYYDSFLRICEYIWERTHKYPKYEGKATSVSNVYIKGIAIRWRLLSEERKYKFYPALLKWMDFVKKQPDNAYWNEKRRFFNEFLGSEEVSKYKP